MSQAVAKLVVTAVQRHGTPPRSTCLECLHFRKADETCQLATPPARPPAEVIAYGCPAYEDEVPF